MNNKLAPHQPFQMDADTKVYVHKDGRSYLTQRTTSGQVTFTPMETVVTQLHAQQSPINHLQPQPLSKHDPLALGLFGLGIFDGSLLLTYFVAFSAGKNGQNVVVPPAPQPVPSAAPQVRCETKESSFGFWSERRKECQ